LAAADLSGWLGTNNTAAPNNYVVTSQTSAGGTFQSRVGTSASLRDDVLSVPALGYGSATFSMSGTVTFDAPVSIVDPVWFFGFYSSANTNHRVGLGAANPSTGDNLRWQIQATAAGGSTLSNVNLASGGSNTNIADGTYPFSLSYSGLSHVITASVGSSTATHTYAFTGANDFNRFGFLQPVASGTNATTFNVSVSSINYTGETQVGGTTGLNAPTNLTASTPTAAMQLGLSWVDNAGNETGFEVQRRTLGGAWTTVSNSVDANTQAFTDTNLLAATTYTYRVRAFNATDTSPWSNVISGTTRANTNVSATNYSRTQIYPAAGLGTDTTYNWNSWLGTWQMPDGSMMVGITRATGPLTLPGVDRTEYDYSGLDIDVVYLRSFDGGAHWSHVADSDVSFATADDSGMGTHANASPVTIALTDGSLIRRVYGWDYGAFPNMPGTTFIQRSSDGGVTWSAMPTSSDGGVTWSDPDPNIQEFLLDPNTTTVQMTRTRRLRDGRLLMVGNVWNGKNTQSAPREPLMVVSSDEAKTWQRITLTGADWTKFNEWDFTELDNGDLFIVARINQNMQVRWQGVMKKNGASWTYQALTASTLPHSGHPELLKSREGPVLHIATTGTTFTTNAGTWNPLRFDTLADRADGDYQSSYYPHSQQAADGWVYVFSHRGADDYYGRTDQAVFMDKFRLTPTASTVTSATPGAPNLAAASDTGSSSTDNLTKRDNADGDETLQFTVGSTVNGARVTVYAGGVAIGSAWATGTTTTVTTVGDFDLTDGTHVITARQIEPLKNESAGSTALNVGVDATAPAATIQPVTPDPRTSGVASVAVTFDGAVSGFNLADLSLKRDAGANLLTAGHAPTTTDNLTFTIPNLLSPTSTSGAYVLSLSASASGIVDAAGNEFAADASESWVHALPAWLSASGSAASWNSLTKALTLTGPATIVADPGAGAPLVSASGAAAVLTINPASDTVIQLGSLNLAGGARATMSPHGGGTVRAFVVQAGNPVIEAGSSLDIADNAMVIRSGNATGVRQLLAASFAAGAWTGSGGVTSSAASADPNGIGAIGYAGNATLGRTSFAGVTGLTGGDVLVRFTRSGDADLSGDVTLDDFTLFLNGYQNAGTTWLQGDFDYGGVVTLDDFTLFLHGYQSP
jgi:hypothetical protein